jgi:hypothetical protein
MVLESFDLGIGVGGLRGLRKLAAAALHPMFCLLKLRGNHCLFSRTCYRILRILSGRKSSLGKNGQFQTAFTFNGLKGEMDDPKVAKRDGGRDQVMVLT